MSEEQADATIVAAFEGALGELLTKIVQAEPERFAKYEMLDITLVQHPDLGGYYVLAVVIDGDRRHGHAILDFDDQAKGVMRLITATLPRQSQALGHWVGEQNWRVLKSYRAEPERPSEAQPGTAQYEN